MAGSGANREQGAVERASEERVAACKKHFGQDQEEPESHQPYVRYGPRGGRYTEETTSDGRTYRRNF